MSNFKRVGIKEELVVLTGDYRTAIILNQLIYCSKRVRDVEEFIKEEKNRDDCSRELTKGWFAKTSEEIAEETLTNMAPATMRRYLKKLVIGGWLNERPNPIDKRDHTKQYRVSIANIQKDLEKLGYTLQN